MYHGRLATSPTYRAPECDLNEDISPSWDIWSLGCVYLEFLTWYLESWDAFDIFSKQRRKQDSARPVLEDKYFILDRRAKFRAKLKTSVTRVRCTF